MRKLGILILVVGVLGFIFISQSLAQRGIKWKGSGGWGPKSQYCMMYDTATVGIFVGEVVDVDTITPIKGMSYGVHMMVKSEKETLSIHLGPGWYIENQDVEIKPQDTVGVRGSKIIFLGKSAIIAAEVKKGNEVLKLRDQKGFPVWAGWRRKS